MRKAHEGLEEMMYMIIVMIILIIGTYIFFYTINSMEFYTKVHDNALIYDILSSRYVYSSNCLAYEDDEGIVHPGVIDSDKWTDANVRNCVSGKNDISIYLRLENADRILEEFDSDLDMNGDIYFVRYYDRDKDTIYPAYLTIQLTGFNPYDEEEGDEVDEES